MLHDEYVIVDDFTEDQYQLWKAFLGKAVQKAERAHTVVGIWDVALAGCTDQEIQEILGEASVNDPNSHFHLSRLSVVVHKPTGQPVATCGGFHFPTYRVSASQPGITAALLKLYPDRCPFPPSEAHQIWDRISFLDDSFPDYDYNDTWMVETVFTDSDHRGKGLAEALVRHVLAKGEKLGHKRSLITCSRGNEKARRVYERCGYQVIGYGDSVKCQKAIGYPGFYVLEKHFQKAE